MVLSFFWNKAISPGSISSYLSLINVIVSSTVACCLSLSTSSILHPGTWYLHWILLSLNTTEKFKGCYPSKRKNCWQSSQSLCLRLWQLHGEVGCASLALTSAFHIITVPEGKLWCTCRFRLWTFSPEPSSERQTSVYPQGNQGSSKPNTVHAWPEATNPSVPGSPESLPSHQTEVIIVDVCP